MKVFARDVIMNLTIRQWIVSQAFLFKLTIIWVICKKKKKNSKVENIARWNIREGYENERSNGGSGKRICTWKFLKGCENEIRSQGNSHLTWLKHVYIFYLVNPIERFGIFNNTFQMAVQAYVTVLFMLWNDPCGVIISFQAPIQFANTHTYFK